MAGILHPDPYGTQGANDCHFPQRVTEGRDKQTDRRTGRERERERDHGRAGRGLSCRTDFGIQIKHMLNKAKTKFYNMAQSCE